MMHPASWIALGVLSIATAISTPSAHAAGGYAAFRSVVTGSSTTVGVASNGTLLASKPSTALTGGSGWVVGTGGAVSIGTSAAGAGAVAVGGDVALTVGGKAVATQVVGQITKTEIAAAVVGCATGGIAGCALSAVPLAIAYMTLSGTRVNPQSGQLEVQEMTGGASFKWFYSNNAEPYYDSALDACRGPSRPTYSVINVTTTTGQCREGIYNAGTVGRARVCPSSAPNSRFGYIPVASGDCPGQSSTWYPATPQTVRDKLYNNNPTPALVDELAKYGNVVWPLSMPKVTGPAEVKGPKVTTIGTQGNKTTTTTSETKTPLTYDGPKVTAGTPVTTKITTTVTTNPDGSTSTDVGTETTTTTTGDTPEGAPEEAAPADTALPELPTLYERKFPDGMTGVWDARKAELMSSPLMSLKDQLLPTIGAGGACPTWSLPINVAWVDFGTYNVAPPCWIWDFGKVIIVLSAMFLARALIFGG